MAIAQSNIDVEKQLAAEIQQTPAEYLPALLTIVHSFRESVEGKEIQAKRAAIEEGLRSAEAGELIPHNELKKSWEDKRARLLDARG